MSNEEIAQYNQLCEDLRHYNSIVWQLPTVSGVLMSIVVTLGYQYVKEILPRFLIFIVGGSLLMGLTVALYKHRFFTDARTYKIREIEEKWTRNNLIASPAQRETTAYSNLIPTEMIRKPKTFLEKQSAVAWLKASMWIMTLILFILAIIHFCQLITSIN